MSLHSIELLLCDRALGKKLPKSLVFAFCICQLYLDFRYSGICHKEIIAGGGDSSSCRTFSGKGVLKIGLCLGESELEFSVLDDYKCVSLADFLELHEADFLYKPLDS